VCGQYRGFCEITPRKVIAVFGAGPVGQFSGPR
jgi:threonine dehydrogenase-like Zn-dependent dehydrogenase